MAMSNGNGHIRPQYSPQISFGSLLNLIAILGSVAAGVVVLKSDIRAIDVTVAEHERRIGVAENRIDTIKERQDERTGAFAEIFRRLDAHGRLIEFRLEQKDGG